MLVDTPLLVPCSLMLTPGMGCPSAADVTVPLMR
jgi:hypothetical protein